MLNFKVLHQNLKIISTIYLLLQYTFSFHEDTDDKIIIKNIKRKIENTPSDYIKEIFQESNIFLSQSQLKNLLRLLSNSSISRKKFNDKRCQICMVNLTECSEFKLANRKIWKIKTNITCRSRNI